MNTLTPTATATYTPSGTETTWDHSFRWSGVTGATWYLLEVYEGGTLLLSRWYTTELAGCAGDTTCEAAPEELSTLGNGDYRWRIQDYGAYGYGQWTPYIDFTLGSTCYTLTTSTNPAGSGVVSATAQNCVGGYTYGTVVQVTAIPAEGFVFTGWSGDASGSANPTTIIMNGAKSVTANLRGVVLTAPQGDLPEWDHMFRWTGFSEATWYLLEVETSTGEPLLSRWYTAELAGCAVDTTCEAAPEELRSLGYGAYRWRIRDWGAYGYGLWTPYKDFTLSSACYTLAPSGTQASWDHTFRWTCFSEATWYLLEVETTTGDVLLSKWYTTESAGCMGDTTCEGTPPELAALGNGVYRWRIRDWGAYGYGQYTPYRDFTLEGACYTLTTAISPAGFGAVSASPGENCPGGYTYGTQVQVSVVPDPGYVFTGWSGAASGTANPTSITMNSDKSVTANLRGGSLTAPQGEQVMWDHAFRWTGFDEATWYLLEVETATGELLLSRWYTTETANCNVGAGCTATAPELATLGNGDYRWRIEDWGAYGYGQYTPYTNFTLNSACYTLATGTSPAGTGGFSATAQNCTSGYTYGTVVQVRVNPGEGYVFTGWSGAASGSANPVSIVMSGNKSVTANLRGVRLTAPQGEQPTWDHVFRWEAATGGTWYLLEVYEGETLLLSRWYTADQAGCDVDTTCEGTPPELEMLGNGDYRWRIRDWGVYGYGLWTPYEDFTLNSTCYTLTTGTSPVGSGIVSATTENCIGGGYTYGTVVQVRVAPNEGFVFTGWSGNASGMANPVSITMRGAKSVTAHFQESVVLSSPYGALPSWDNTFQWTGVTGATWYLLEVYTLDGTQVFYRWYLSSEIGCTGRTTCRVSPDDLIGLADGSYKWRILDYGDYGYGPWVAFKEFTLTRD